MTMGALLPGVAWALRARWRSYYDEHERWRDAPWALVGTCVDAVLTGVGIGLCFAVAVLIVAVTWKRLTS